MAAMDERDVILSAFAIPPESDYRDIAMPIDLFTEEPIVVGIDPDYSKGAGSDAGGFAQAAENYRDQDGYILRRLLRARLTGVKVRRIALIGFSAGGTFVSKVLGAADAENIDSVMALDAVHLQRGCKTCPFFAQSIGPWASFGVRAARGVTETAGVTGPMLLLSHTAIRQGPDREEQVGNTNESAAAIYEMVQKNSPDALRIGVDPGLMLAGPPPPPVTISVRRPIAPGQSVPITKTWDVMPEPVIHATGNCWAFDYGGNNEADHIFQARYVQGALWRSFLAPRWNAGLDC